MTQTSTLPAPLPGRLRRARRAVLSLLLLAGLAGGLPAQGQDRFIVENLKAVGVEARIQNYDFSIIFGTFEDNSPSSMRS